MNERQLPSSFPSPSFQIGSKVQWQSASADRGLVLGMRYLWAEHLNHWQWQYYVTLDRDSPSRHWTEYDWAWQDDLDQSGFQSTDLEEIRSDDQ